MYFSIAGRWNEKFKKKESNGFAYSEIILNFVISGTGKIVFLGIMIRELVCLLLAYVWDYVSSHNYI